MRRSATWFTLVFALLALGMGGPGEPRGATPTVQVRPPRVLLDRLEFPAIPGAKGYERHLRQVLKREVRRVNWGAGAQSSIEYRFRVRDLTLERKEGVLLVRCSASGQLPRGRSVTSELSFGGDPRAEVELVKRVLTIVARGIVARLADMERARRAQ